MTHEDGMRLALALAEEAAAQGEVPVGAVIIKDDRVIGTGRNRRESDNNALAHAEIEAIAMACRTLGCWRLTGCTLYVTLEPCPMCAGAIINARLDAVVYGAVDPKAGSVDSMQQMFELPYNHHPTVVRGILQEDCSSLLTSFFRSLRHKQ